jgi:hypothetical protein
MARYYPFASGRYEDAHVRTMIAATEGLARWREALLGWLRR